MAVQRKAAPQKKATAAPKKKVTPRAPRGGGEDEQGGGQSRADAFDSQKPMGAIDGGKYVALIGEAVLGKEDEKGQSARFVYEIATEGEFRGQKCPQFYKLFEADGSVGKGAAFLKKDLAVLGKGDVKFGDLENAFEEIVNDQIGCNVTVKQSGQFTNVYLNSITEDTSVIDDYLANRPY